jgi:hypothetical protein
MADRLQIILKLEMLAYVWERARKHRNLRTKNHTGILPHTLNFLYISYTYNTSFFKKNQDRFCKLILGYWVD